MASHRMAVAGAAGLAFALPSLWFGQAAVAGTHAVAHHSERCFAGAHTLSPVGAHLYPDTGNGGYSSLHTDVHLVYDATTNRFGPAITSTSLTGRRSA